MKLLLRISGLMLVCALFGCKVNYSFTGASIAPDIKTISIKTFQKQAALGPPSLSQVITEKLKDRFVSQTQLNLADRNADLNIEGSITNYTVAPLAIQTNEQAASNRLTITVSAKFTNIKDEKQNFEASFSRYSDFRSDKNLSSVEDALIADITTQIVDDIFNRAVINW